jgi:hypothetical protein
VSLVVLDPGPINHEALRRFDDPDNEPGLASFPGPTTTN